ncbi:nucleolar pre-ribosomal-associated protein 1-like [Vidua macroura]|uniref:nucleolar pre-ribosomal-associated protein 1-like n=1 Tax=Vidua macroura TaxID=187451 RepID=UPI0023A88991|nr:nucleolar pre-ribosomal-associated protein 1-like [Vidua macroura]
MKQQRSARDWDAPPCQCPERCQAVLGSRVWFWSPEVRNGSPRLRASQKANQTLEATACWKISRGGVQAAQAAERGPGFPRPFCRHLWKVKSRYPLGMSECLTVVFFFMASSTKQHEWILRFLGEGLRDKHCCELYVYQGIFQVIPSFLSSPLCDEGSQRRILEIRQSAARVTSRAAHELIEDHSLLSGVLHGLEKRFLENQVINNMISLLHPLWLINLGDKRENRNRSQMLLLRWTYDLSICI